MNTIFQQVCDWVRGTLGEVEITAEPPQNASDTVTVSIYFKNMDISPAVGVSSVGKRLQLLAAYLITIASPNRDDANNAIVKLAFSAMLTGNFTPVFNPLSAEEWLAFGVAPKPALMIHMPITYEIEGAVAKRVEYPLEINMVTLGDQEAVT